MMIQSIPTFKAIPISNSELERVQREFKLYSPVEKSCKSASLPKNGEGWKLIRTLPSGLLVSYRPKRKWWQKILGSETEVKDDVRHLQYDIERYQREIPDLFVQIRDTYSVSWHPNGRLLVTAGDGIIAKLWEAETGSLITREPLYSTSPGNTISWSQDGEIFAVDQCLFNGNTGEKLLRTDAFIPGPGPNAYDRYRFGPWRPNSNQYILHDMDAQYTNKWAFNPWKPDTDQYGKCLVFRNRRTGEVEKVIECYIPSSPIDWRESFAWHPSGRFIAVAFENHNICIIDTESVKTVDSLSVHQIVGWSPDGKVLVAKKEKDEFVVWDALEIKERPMPEEMRNEIWFKRFSNNISADGLRYIKEANIYSVDTNELIATLPKHVSSAAWSPMDGRILATCGRNETHIWKL